MECRQDASGARGEDYLGHLAGRPLAEQERMVMAEDSIASSTASGRTAMSTLIGASTPSA
jgi:hypothetical protein